MNDKCPMSPAPCNCDGSCINKPSKVMYVSNCKDERLPELKTLPPIFKSFEPTHLIGYDCCGNITLTPYNR